MLREARGQDRLAGMKRALPWVFAAAAVAFGLVRLRYGVNFSDEGFSLSSPLRYALGDVPFRDEVLNPLRWFDILMTPFVGRTPVAGQVLAFRCAGFIFHVMCWGALLWAPGRRLPDGAAPLVFAAGLFSNFCGYWTPTYHSASADLLFAAVAFFLRGIERPGARAAALFGCAGGVAFFLASVCEIPLLALVIVPAGFAAWFLFKRGTKSPPAVCAGAFFAAAAGLSVCAGTALLRSGLYPDLIAALKSQMMISGYGGNFYHRAGRLAGEMSAAAPYFFTVAAFTIFIIAALSFRGAWRRPFYVLSIAAICSALLFYAALPAQYILSYGDFFLTAFYMEGVCLVAMLGFPVSRLLFRTRPRETGGEGVVFLWIFAVLWHAALAVMSLTGIVMAACFTFPVFLAIFVVEFQRIISSRGEVEKEMGLARELLKRAAVWAICMGAGAVVVSANLFSMHENSWIWGLDTAFGEGKLRGIYSTRAKVENTEALVEYLSPRLRRGELLLSFNDNPMLYYLTETRSALCTGLPDLHWPVEARREFVDKMIERGRAPRYAVNAGAADTRDPIYNYVAARYTAQKSFGAFTVWRKNGLFH